MFLYRVKVEELDNVRLASLQDDLARSEPGLRAQCPIREMSVVAEGDADRRLLDICLALDDIIGGDQLRKLVAKLNSFLDFDFKPGKSEQRPRVSSELIHI
ncbi:MAG: hypothetical protein ISS15_16335 [Alphaproteobacteria bacterium]|nr:hypothetical protein [Alphaproteobacteria bacterium]MBL6937948.1 hypothetical protein [Alphaproteobacteria bacterium]MBL7099227.1 hypothetical protein [Alphaproteobacteria bacterium]